MSSHLPWFAERVAGHPQFLGTARGGLRDSEQLADEALARVAGMFDGNTDSLAVVRYATLRRPVLRPGPRGHRQHGRCPSGGASAGRARGQTLLRLQAATAGQVKPASLLAARTRPPKKTRGKSGVSHEGACVDSATGGGVLRAAGRDEPFPRDLQQATAFALPVTLVYLRRLRLNTVRAWLERNQVWVSRQRSAIAVYAVPRRDGWRRRDLY